MKKQDEYQGFEQGPIRPPSEADSLLIRLTRNCPWNRCTFCRVYKRSEFSLRTMENILKDIDCLYHYIERIKKKAASEGYIDNAGLNTLFNTLKDKDRMAFNAAANWYASGMKSIFLQDANSLIMKPDDLVYILEYLKKCFPDIDRITTYARSHTIVRIKQGDLLRIADAGLNRVHVGMESGSDIVLKMVNKGASKASHIKAGLKIKRAGMELSEYVMPGLGGIEYSIEHAMETASALNRINPDFIRIRTLAVTRGTKLAEEAESGAFQKPTDIMIAKELRLFLETLDGIDSYIKSDHILNLFETIEGKMPDERDKMIGIIDYFFNLDPDKRVLYQVGRRMGLFRGPHEMEENPHIESVRQACDNYKITSENIDSVIDYLMKRFI